MSDRLSPPQMSSIAYFYHTSTGIPSYHQALISNIR